MKIHSMKKQANGILIFICSLWLIIGLISKNFQNIGIALLGDSMVVDVRRAKKKKKKVTVIAKRLLKSVSML